MRRSQAADALAAGLLLIAVSAIYLLVWTATGWRPPQAPSFGSAVLATTLVAVLARPAHRWLRSAVRRRAGVPVVSVARSVRDTIEAGRSPGSPDDVGARLLTVLVTAVRPQSAELWTGTGAARRRIARWPTDRDTPEPSAPVRERPLTHAGSPIGLLRIQLRHDDPEQHDLLGPWCNQAGQILAVLAHREDLRRREVALVRRRRLLRLSRVRLAAAERTARRRIERDLHDGAQQQLLAVGLALQVARRSAGRSPERTHAALGRAVDLARRSVDALSRVSCTLYPTRLRTGHLGEVIEQAVGGGDLVVTVDPGAGGVGDDLTAEVRTALYFAAVEAVQNAVKHGRATHAAIRLWTDDSAVHLEIADDGVGLGLGLGQATGHPGTGDGAGLRHLDTRLREAGGRLTVRDGREGGTTVTATVPRTDPGHPATPDSRAGESVSA